MNNVLASPVFRILIVTMVSAALWGVLFGYASAATLAVSPATGVYKTGGTFSVKVQVHTGGKSVNAAEGTLSFDPSQLSVVSASRSGSIFSLWVTEPAFSNAAGTISFSGGSPAGYSGSVGSVMTVTFRAKTAGTAKLNFKTGSVLANDGKGSNILTGMSGGTYTIQAASALPEPEIIEYVAPANTPAAPKITSTTHPDPAAWYTLNEARLAWTVPVDVTAVRTLLDDNPTSVPTKVYDTPIRDIVLSDLEESVSYFHIQFKNADGWGRVAHYRLAIDSQNPTAIDIVQAPGTNQTNPEQEILVTVEDETSRVLNYKVKVDAAEPFLFEDKTGSGTIALPPLEPGYHTVIVEAFDQAGNSIVGTYSFTIESFDKPIFTDYPTSVNEGVIPVIKGQTRANAEVTITLRRAGVEASHYVTTADVDGQFVFIPEAAFQTGVYELSAVAVDEFGAKSEGSDAVKIAVQKPGYLQIGTMLISVLSVLIPLIVLLFVLGMGLWYAWYYVRRFRKRVRVESFEAIDMLRKEFAVLHDMVNAQEEKLRTSRRTNKLTKAETEVLGVVRQSLHDSEQRVEKEVQDVTELVKKDKNSQ